MKYIPHNYQKEGIRWIKAKKRCALFWDMGLGKSVATLTAIQELIDECEIKNALIVAPKKVAETTWTTEAQKWDHLQGLTIAKVMGTEKQRLQALNTEADAYVIGRDTFAWLVGYYVGGLPFDMIVIDELTSFKSPKSARFKAMKIASPTADRVVGLTGTPTPNGLIDLWAQMYCIDLGERLGKSVTRYRDAYFDQVRHNNIVIKTTARKGTEQAIKHKIEDICLSMQAKDYLKLPELIIHNTEIELTPKTQDGYKSFERDRVLEFQKAHREALANTQASATIIANGAAALMNKLSQYANGAVYDEDGLAHEIHNEKLDRLKEIVEAANGENILIFYQYKHDKERIKKCLKGYNIEEYNGEKELKRWNSGKINILLSHPASTAYGLNLQQGGRFVIWFGTGWNLELYQQANARLHRQGQTKPVMVYQLYCKNTVDEKAANALTEKKNKQQALLDSLRVLLTEHRTQNEEIK